MDLVAQALAQRSRTGAAAAVLVLDLDKLKLIGHQAGDELLATVAPRLVAAPGPPTPWRTSPATCS